MVNIKTIATLGVLAAAVGVFFAAGGASGIGRTIGSSIGGGLSSFGSSLTNAFTSALGTGGGNVNSNTGGKTISGSGAATVDGVNTVQDKIVQEGGVPTEVLGNVDTSPLALAFKDDFLSGNISQEFAKRFSFQPDTPSGVLDVSKTFSFISERGGIASFNPEFGTGRAITPFGGFGSAESQRAALTAAIERSSLQNPQFFG